MNQYYTFAVMREDGHPIKVVARRVGLSPHVVRMWEKRYRAVVPRRTPTRRRIYSDADVERLVLLRRAIAQGRSIGQIAHLSTDKLLALVEADETARGGAHGASLETGRGLRLPASEEGTVGPRPQPDAGGYVEQALAAVKQFDPATLESALAHAAVALGQTALIEQVVVPLLYRVGELWRDGELRVAHEHLASAVVRSFLGSLRGAFEPSAVAPNLVVATPLGQLHELGALLVAATAVSEGWRVTYLGANLPAEELAGAARQSLARAVALSIVYPADDPRVRRELEQVRHYLGPTVPLLVGGRAAGSYDATLRATGAVRLDDLRRLRAYLETLRAQPPQG
ncbi:MAG: MerR family transcriptional regulator [Thermodesulfobacteriota bacterium]|jgi:DNA-binding transcriptional MerR regulator/methylmalonyl-CoA mutase cobalamin-binding subunit